MRFAGLSLPPSARETFDKSSISGEGVEIKDEAEFPPRPDFSSQITEIPRANSHISRLMRREQRESRRGGESGGGGGGWILSFNAKRKD